MYGHVTEISIWNLRLFLTLPHSLVLKVSSMRFTLYDFTFAIFLIFTALAIAGSAASLIFQARLTGGAEANWNVFVVVGSYLALV